MFDALYRTLRARPASWLGIALGFIAAYHALLLAAMILRFGHWPNFVRVYDLVESWRLVFSGTPSLFDALSIAIAEPWLDVGYVSPQWKIAEWSLMILPPQLTLIAATGALLATYAILRQAAHGAARRPVSGCALGAACGAGLAGLANATLFWVVCCATPTWTVALAMLGVSVSTAFFLQPLGPLLTAAGFVLLAWAVIGQLRALRHAARDSRVSSFIRNGVPAWL